MDGRELKAKAAITGLGITEMGRVYGHGADHFAAEAIQRAVADAGLRKDQIDGLLVNPGVTPLGGMGGVGLQNYLGLTNLRLLSSMNVGGATANVMVQYAALLGHPRHRQPRRLRLRRCAPAARAAAAAPRTPAWAARRGPSGMGGLYTRLRRLRRQRPLRPRRAPPHGHVRHHERPARRHRRRRAPVGREEPDRRAPRADHASRTTTPRAGSPSRSTCSTAASSRTAASPSSSRAPRRRSDMAQPPAYVWGMGQGHPGDMRRKGWDVETRDRRADGEGEGLRHGRHRRRRHRRRAGVRLLHLHRARHARGLRLLQEGRGRPLRRRRQARARRQPADEHRRRPAQRLLHVGHDAAVARASSRRAARAASARSTSTTSCSSPATAASSITTARSCCRRTERNGHVSTGGNKARMRRRHDEMNRHNAGACDTLLTDDYVEHNNMSPEPLNKAAAGGRWRHGLPRSRTCTATSSSRSPKATACRHGSLYRHAGGRVQGHPGNRPRDELRCH